MIVMPADSTGIRMGYLCGRFPGRVGHLFTPRAGRKPPGPFPFAPYAMDNAAFGKTEDQWSESDWIKMMDWAKLSGQDPLWALVPDVVGDRARTLLRWDKYAPVASQYGWPLAFAVQDGMTAADVTSDASVVFVGGTTEWKWATVGRWCREFPHVHVGRVNTYRHLWICHEAGADSVDGSGWFRDVQGKQSRGLMAYLQESTGAMPRALQMGLLA